MITAIELENFKGVSDRQRIELGPLTLLFGANNAGKSTILQALLYVLEVLETGRADVDRTELGGEAVDLGGFERVVHRHDLTRIVRIRVEFDTPATLNVFGRDLNDTPFVDLDDQIESAWLEVTTRWDRSTGYPYASSLCVGTGLDKKPLLRLLPMDPWRPGEPVLAELELSHSLFADTFFELRPLLEPLTFQFVDECAVFWLSSEQRSAVPELQSSLRLLGTDDGDSISVLDATALLELFAVGPARQLVRCLRDALHVGPLRAIPPRSFLLERSRRLTRWSDGLAAWDALLADRNGLLERTNAWLARLGAGCKLIMQRLEDRTASAEETTAEQGSAVVRRLLVETRPGVLNLPCEVGAGISQVVPIIVAALVGGRGRLVMLEQPELHVHPALQVELGDLMIEASRDRQMIVETHSEHLILRLLRRIRETTGGEVPEGKPSFTPEGLSVLHVEAGKDGMRVQKLRVDGTGEFVDRWPKGFFEERAKELF